VERAQYETKRRELPVMALSSFAMRDPQGALAEMNEGNWSTHLDADTVSRMKSIAELSIATAQAKSDSAAAFDKADFGTQLERYGRHLANGGGPLMDEELNLTPDRAGVILGSETAAKAASHLAAQREMGAYFSQALSGDKNWLENQTTALRN